jgi:hypothetical protein
MAAAKSAADIIKLVHQVLGGKSANIISTTRNFDRNVEARKDDWRKSLTEATMRRHSFPYSHSIV